MTRFRQRPVRPDSGYVGERAQQLYSVLSADEKSIELPVVINATACWPLPFKDYAHLVVRAVVEKGTHVEVLDHELEPLFRYVADPQTNYSPSLLSLREQPSRDPIVREVYRSLTNTTQMHHVRPDVLKRQLYVRVGFGERAVVEEVHVVPELPLREVAAQTIDRAILGKAASPRWLERRADALDWELPTADLAAIAERMQTALAEVADPVDFWVPQCPLAVVDPRLPDRVMWIWLEAAGRVSGTECVMEDGVVASAKFDPEDVFIWHQGTVFRRCVTRVHAEGQDVSATRVSSGSLILSDGTRVPVRNIYKVAE